MFKHTILSTISKTMMKHKNLIIFLLCSVISLVLLVSSIIAKTNTTVVITLESDMMDSQRKITSRPNTNIKVYGKTTYGDDGSAAANYNLTFKYDGKIIGTNNSDNSGSYNFTFTIPYEGNYSFEVSTVDASNNTGKNVTTMLIISRPINVKFRLTYWLGSSKTGDVYRIATAGTLKNETIGDSNINDLQYRANLSKAYICTHDEIEYSNGMTLAMIHSRDAKDLSFVNFSATTGKNYTIELEQKIEASSMLLAFTKGTCANPIGEKMYMVENQVLPGTALGSFSLGAPNEYQFMIRTQYDRIEINGTEHFGTGSHRLCIEKSGISSGNRPIVDVRRC